MNPALKTSPLNAIPRIAQVVCILAGKWYVVKPNNWKRGIGTHKNKNVQTPIADVSKFGKRAKGGG